MSTTIRISPPNSILFVSDRDGGVTPEITREQSIWATPSCVAFGCLMEQDGPTELTIGAAEQVGSRDTPAFDDLIETPQRAVVVFTALNQPILHASVSGIRTRLRIWTNHPTEPDKVIIGL